MPEPPQCSHITASGHPDYPPFSWRNGEEIVGTSADLIRDAADRLGIPITIKYSGHWKRVITRLQKNELDLVVALYKDDLRGQKLAYGPAIVTDPVGLFVSGSSPSMGSDWSILAGKRGAIVHGEVFGAALDKNIQTLPRLRRADDISALLRLVELARVDFIIHGEYPVLAALHKQHSQTTLRKVATIGKEPSYFAMAPASPCKYLIEPLAAEIEKIKADAPLQQKIHADFERWTGMPSTSLGSP
ncbi:ABC-type amino acid transport substrate-binding protein [Kordiimonas lacus]|uniref:ABC-type amino acid transport substrate-binding protein n=2 Tax=Kordiimonas lacus TaxID=637679 RepID=A0A1G7E5T1_9PROT|nr:ABC-type amino acid transport substrate-binding protein [Kordiimonas lacus]